MSAQNYCVMHEWKIKPPLYTKLRTGVFEAAHWSTGICLKVYTKIPTISNYSTVKSSSS